MSEGLRIERRFTTEGVRPEDTVEWSRRDSRITNPDGSVVFEMTDAEIPAAWSQVAADIVVSKYFRKAGVPQRGGDGEVLKDEDGSPVLGAERSVRQVVSRLASTWRWWGERHGYFATRSDAAVFEDEVSYMLLHQVAAPNSPQWFNTGLHHNYGIEGPPQGFWYVDPETEELTPSPDSYSRPAPHACFPAGTSISTPDGLKPIEDVEVGEAVLTHERRYRRVIQRLRRRVEDGLVRITTADGDPETSSPGSSPGAVLTATENHPIRAIRRSAVDLGPTSTLQAEWIDAGKLEVGDYVFVLAGPVHARIGGKPVRKVVDVTREPFTGTVYNLQVAEDETYVADGIVVHNCFIQSVNDDLVNEGGIMDLWVREARLFKYGAGTGSNFSEIRSEGESLSGGGKSSGLMSFLKVGDRAAGAIKSGGTTRRAAKMVILDVDHPDIEAFINWKVEEENKVRALVAAGYSPDFNGDAYATVSGQNSNNSVRLSNEFIEAVLADDDWELTARTDGAVMKVVKARELWSQIAEAAWGCADPGVQFDTTIQEWHTCPTGGRIRATNPCSEYVFLDNTACNLASLNLGKFYDDASGDFDIDAYKHAIRLWTVVLEISVTMAHFPSREIAQGSYDYRTLGLGYANLGSLLMRMGIPYDSEEGRAIAAALTAILTGHAYTASAEMAQLLGPFPKFEDNREAMLRVMRNHRRATYDADQDDYDGVSHVVMGIDADVCPVDLLTEARNCWDQAVKLGIEYGYRNAQSTVLAPTGTIGLLLDCDTTGVEPDFALVKFKKLAGGGYFKIANQSIEPALRMLGYSEQKIQQILDFVVGTGSMHRAPHINSATLIANGFTAHDVEKIETILPGVFELRFAFNRWTLGEETLQRLGFAPAEYEDSGFDLLTALGFSEDQILEANDYVCGRQAIEGAPGLLDEHLPIFDCANRNGRHGQRLIHHAGHIKMMAVAQPFISGSISKTTNMPNEVTPGDIEEAYRLSWELGLKCMALYRDGSKMSQPLAASAEEGASDDEPEGLDGALTHEMGVHAGMFQPGISPTKAYEYMPRPRFLLPARRTGFTQEARVGGHKVFVRTGDYEDGTLGELFIDLAKEGATLRGILSCFAIAVSKGLQYGVPLDEFVDTFTFQTFEPRGMVEGHPNIKMANSIIDYVFRSLGIEYLHRDDLAQVPPERASSLPEPPQGAVIDAGTQLGLDEAAKELDITVQLEAAAFVDSDERAPVPPPPPGKALSPGPGAMANPDGNGAAVNAGVQTKSVQAVLADKMGDAPLCDTCGHITVRNGSCYRCLNCGDSKGCS